MKTIEEKAKAYDETIEKLRDFYRDYDTVSHLIDVKEELANLIPELKESENERMRKWLIGYFNQYKIDGMGDFANGYKVDDIIAWLEKQKDYIKPSHSAYTSSRDIIEFADKYSHAIWKKLMDELKKNENFSIGCNDVSDIVLNAIINTHNWFEKQKEQKPTEWGEKDERIKKEVLLFLKEGKPYYCPNSAKRQEWTTWLEKFGEYKEDTCIAEMIDRLSEKEQDILFKELDLQKEQKPIEWTEKDKVKLFNIKTALYDYYSKGNAEELMDWIKNYKPTIDETSYQVGIKRVLDNPESYGLVRKEDGGRFFNMIQWTGDNLKQVVKFTGKSPKFDEWFKTWEDFENYVHSHNNIFKIFNEDGSHYEVPVGAWIIKTPDGHNLPSKYTLKQKFKEWTEEDQRILKEISHYCFSHTDNAEWYNWLISLPKPQTR